MIEVSARLSQGVYLAGEAVEVAVTFRNPSPPPDATSQRNDEEEVLALASAQIHCQCWVSAAKVVVPEGHQGAPEGTAVTNSLTSFAPCSLDAFPVGGPGVSTGSGSGSGSHVVGLTNGSVGVPSPNAAAVSTTSRVVTATKPTIMFCDLRLLPGESKTYWYKETIPVDGPPSFRGQTVKYAYKLTIGTQRVNSPIRLLRVPLRTLVLQEFTDTTILNGNVEERHPRTHVREADANQEPNGGLPAVDDMECELHQSPVDSALQILQIVTSQRNQKFYNVTNARGHVVKFCIFKHAYKLGEDIVGSLDFSGCSVPCLQYAVTLQSVEEVSAECRASESQRPAISSFSKAHELCVGFQQTHFVLPVPLHVTPSFYTELVSLKWRLHFEFVTTTEGEDESVVMQLPKKPGPDQLNGETWHAPSDIKIETMVWDLPLKLYPNLPSYISQGLQTQAVFEMKIGTTPSLLPSH